MKRFLVNKSTVSTDKSITTNLMNLTPTDSKQLESSFDEEVFDISDNIDEQAYQPRMIYNKYRSFNSSWYSKYPWIEYSKQKDRIYCYYLSAFRYKCK